jgi:putative oxidoreductase
MNSNLTKYGLPTVKTLVTLAFLAAGIAKLASAEMMVGVFDAVGVGQWFRYVTGAIEVAAAVLLWVPGLQFIGAGLLAATMGGAVLAHIFILGTATMLPAVVLGLLAALLTYSYREQSPIA